MSYNTPEQSPLGSNSNLHLIETDYTKKEVEDLLEGITLKSRSERPKTRFDSKPNYGRSVYRKKQ